MVAINALCYNLPIPHDRRRHMALWSIAVILVIALLVITVAVIIIRTLTFRSKQLSVPAVAGFSIDANSAADRLSRAVQFKTVSLLDNSLVDYEPFRLFHEFLEKAFPLVHATLEKKIINKYGLVYTWQGSDTQAKPVLFLAHQDVVPASNEGWKHPPFSGAIAEGYVWGRGALDDKGSLMSILESIEFLIKDGFKPSRSVYLAFGYDEEVGEKEGAGKIASYFRSEGMQFEYIIDEGGAITRGLVPGVPGWVALVGTAEKGYLSLELSAEGQGGHANQPPRQTAVGILAAAIDRLEKNPFPIRFTGPSAAIFSYLGPEMPFVNRMVFANLWLFSGIVKSLLAARPVTDASIRTTIAPTMFQGSPQDNILPMLATAVVNFRIVQGETVKSVTERVTAVINDPRVRIKPIEQNKFEPSPVSNTTSWGFSVLSKTVKQTIPSVFITPTLVLGRTDTSYYYDLSSCCYRFVPEKVPGDEMACIHGINERVSVEGYGEMIGFYIQLMRNSCL
jgi:carboxypeptidase PM20D1